MAAEHERITHTNLSTEGIAGAYLASGWCGRCGGKRDRDNNCINCDRWYNHPLLTLGGTLTVSLVLLMLVGIRALRDADPGFARFASGAMYAASVPAFVPTVPVTSGFAGPPRYFQAAGPIMPVAAPTTPKVSPLEAQFAELESLRETVHTNEYAFRTGIVVPESTPSSKSRMGRETAQVAMVREELPR